LQDRTKEISMRRVCAWELVSVDGTMESPEEWAFPYSDAEMGEASASGMARSDALLLGRVTYEHLATYWPDRPGGTPMVDFLNDVPKYIVSGTLEEPLGRNNSVLIKGNVAEEIAKLKRQQGKDITVLGSGELVRSLLRGGLLDELTLMVHTESGCILLSMSEKGNSGESESSQLEGFYRKASDPVLRTHLLMVWRISLGDSIREVAEMVGYSEKWVREIARRYESEGVEGLGDRRHGNPGAKERALLDEERQADLREALLEESPPGGGMWSGPKVARWIEETTGMEKVHAQRGWEYLRKVGMSPQVPRPSNAQGADSEEREAFKKVSR
jgi:dihydrofolate reductase/transposase